MRRHDYPDKCEMRFNGLPYEVNLRAFRRGLVYRQIEGLYLSGQAELAAAANSSRSTVNRLFGGRSVSLRMLAAVAGALGLDVNTVITALGPNPESSRSGATLIGAQEGEATSRSRDIG